MRILAEARDGSSVRVMVMVEDDLWTLKNVIRKNDAVVSVVFRRVESADDRVRSKESSRKPVVVKVRVEEVEFRKFSGALRISGVIVEGGESVKGEHQSINVGVKDEIEIIKERWTRDEMDLLRESINSETKGTTVFVTLDDESAEVYEMRSYGLMPVATIYSGKSGKAYESGYRETDYFAEIWETLRGRMHGEMILVILGPGFTRDHFESYMKSHPLGISVFSFATGRNDRGGIYEFMESERGEGLLKEARLRKEQSYVDRFMKALGKNEPVAYGIASTSSAADIGAISTLLVTEEAFRTDQCRDLMEKVRRNGGEVHILSSHDEPGVVVEKFGGFCAILRYNVQGDEAT